MPPTPSTYALSSDELAQARQRVLPLVRRLEFREQAVLPPLQTLLGVYEIVASKTSCHDAGVYVATREARRTFDAHPARTKFTYPDSPGKLGRGVDWTPSTLAAYCEQSAKHARKRLTQTVLDSVTVETRRYQLRDEQPSFGALPPLIGLARERSMLEAHLRNLFMYDPAQQVNTNSGAFPHGITLVGPPGTGKSSLLTHVVSMARELETIAGTPCTIATYDASRFSSYFGRSTRILKQLLEQAKRPTGVGILIMEDADMVFQNRSDDTISRGVLEVQQYLMNALSGLEEDKGNFLALFTTNRLDRFDDALRSRFGVSYLIDPFARRETHIEYFATRAGHLSEAECAHLAEQSHTATLSGRDLAAVITNANASVATVPTDAEIQNKRMRSEQTLPAAHAYSNAIAARRAAQDTQGS